MNDSFNNWTFLVIDDSPVVRKHLEKLLIHAGAKVNSYDYPPDIDSLPFFDAAIVDFMYRDKTAMNFLQSCRVRFPDAILILISAINDLQVIAAEALQYTDGAMIKPFSDENFLNHVMHLMKSRYFRQNHTIWVARRNPINNKPELFESPLVDSITGGQIVIRSFQIYKLHDHMVLWLLNHDHGIFSQNGQITDLDKSSDESGIFRYTIGVSIV